MVGIITYKTYYYLDVYCIPETENNDLLYIHTVIHYLLQLIHIAVIRICVLIAIRYIHEIE